MPSSIDSDGVILYRLSHVKARPVSRSLIIDINAWRTVMHELGWIGQDPARYGGNGYGNVSRRLTGKKFLISGTQTGARKQLDERHYAAVTHSRPEENHVFSRGPCRPSSESMTHAVIYDSDPRARVIIHVHAPLLWNAAAKLRLPTTRASVPYGTPAMAAEVRRLFLTRQLQRRKIFAMLGHRDGIISYGKTADEAGFELIRCSLVVLRSHEIRSMEEDK